ncbi:MAG: hypothetical protein WCT20_05635 [Candidatus Babeliales bacterium]|jgi:hypothetical protein
MTIKQIFLSILLIAGFNTCSTFADTSQKSESQLDLQPNEQNHQQTLNQWLLENRQKGWGEFFIDLSSGLVGLGSFVGLTYRGLNDDTIANVSKAQIILAGFGLGVVAGLLWLAITKLLYAYTIKENTPKEILTTVGELRAALENELRKDIFLFYLMSAEDVERYLLNKYSITTSELDDKIKSEKRELQSRQIATQMMQQALTKGIAQAERERKKELIPSMLTLKEKINQTSRYLAQKIRIFIDYEDQVRPQKEIAKKELSDKGQASKTPIAVVAK